MPELFQIDQNQLDVEWLSQPKLFYDAAVDLADKKQRYEEAKASRDVVVAELDKRIRRDPENYSIARVSEGAIEKVIWLQEDYLNATRLVQKRRHAVDIAQALVDALDHRKRALENLVHLHAQNYFSTPKAKGEVAREAVQEAAKKRARSKR